MLNQVEYNFQNFNAFIKSIFKQYRWKFIEVLVFYFFKHSPIWAMPFLIARLIDLPSGDPAKRMHLLFLYCGLMIFFVSQNFITHVRYIKKRSEISRNIGINLRMKICTHLQQLSILYHHKTSVGRLHSKIIRDVESIESIPAMFVENFFSMAVSIIVAFVSVLIRAPFALIFFVFLSFSGVYLQRKFWLTMRKNAKLLRTSIENMSASISDMMTMMPVTKAHGLEETQLYKIGKKIFDVFHQGINFDVTIARFASLSWISFMTCQIVFLGISVYMSFQKIITVGDVVMFNAYFTMISNSIAAILNVLPEVTRVRESAESLIEVMSRPDIEQNEGKNKITSLNGTFEFENVSYRYPGSDLHALQGVSFKVVPGQSIGIVGPSGCGKTTVLFMIMGFIRPTSGRVFIDGQDINDIDCRTYRNFIGVVSQESVFFSGSVRENITYGQKEIKPEKVIEVLKLSNSWDFIKNLPNGMDTYFGESGVNFSGGQKQRLAVARALVRNPKILIMDEPTSQLDIESELILQEAIEQVMKIQTTFIVSHRFSAIRGVDTIIVMDQGRITASGSHEELMKFDNRYSNAYRKSLL